MARSLGVPSRDLNRLHAIYTRPYLTSEWGKKINRNQVVGRIKRINPDLNAKVIPSLRDVRGFYWSAPLSNRRTITVAKKEKHFPISEVYPSLGIKPRRGGVSTIKHELGHHIYHKLPQYAQRHITRQLTPDTPDYWHAGSAVGGSEAFADLYALYRGRKRFQGISVEHQRALNYAMRKHRKRVR